MTRSAELLLASLIDYAGTFPPAGLMLCAFVFTDEALSWRGSQLSANQFADTRRHFFVGFGSCSFTEPVDELVRLGVITLEAGSLTQPHAEVP